MKHYIQKLRRKFFKLILGRQLINNIEKIENIATQQQELIENLNRNYSEIGNQQQKFFEFLENIFMEIKNQQQTLVNTFNGNYLDYSFELIQKTIELQATHQKTFGSYKNYLIGKSVVLIATGPSLNYFDPEIVEHDAIYVGVNAAFKFEKVTLDYLFMQDYIGARYYLEDSLYYKNKELKRFYGSLKPDIEDGWTIPDNIIISHGASKYYAQNVWYRQNVKNGWGFAVDLTSEILRCYGSITFPAMQFILYCNPKRIYIIGCDVHNITQHTVDQLVPVPKDEKGALYANQYGWKKLKEFIDIYYPGIEVISVNPVGLKGLFKNVYTESYLKEHPEISVL